MQKVTVQVEIDAPAEKVWEVLADFGNISAFNPNLTNSHLTADQPNGVGATRHCDLTVGGASIEERIVDWDEGHSYTVDVYGGKRVPFTQAFGHLAVEPLGESRSVASMSFEGKAKGGVFAGLLGRALRGQNKKAITGVLAGLKHHVETGDPVEGRQKVDSSAVIVV